MKFLEPTVTVILMSHMKPQLGDALASFQDQTRLQDVQLLVVDSGAWLGKMDEISQHIVHLRRQYASYPNLEWYLTGEPANFRDIACPVSHWTNSVLKNGLARGKYIAFLYDDDIYYPTFIEKMAGYLDQHPDAMAVRCSENRTILHADGTRESTGPLMADREIMQGENMDCIVDGMQVMVRKEVFDKIGDEPFPEDPDWNSCSHSDGIFFSKMSQVIDKLHCIPEVLCEHRNTIHSTFTPST